MLTELYTQAIQEYRQLPAEAQEEYRVRADEIERIQQEAAALVRRVLLTGKDVRGDAKPRSEVWMNGKTVWFTLYRIAKYPTGNYKVGEWIPITRTHKVNAKRKATVLKVVKAQAQQAQFNAAKQQAVATGEKRVAMVERMVAA